MSFKKEESSLMSKRFVSENEIAEIKQKREEEWALARQQGREIEKEEEVVFDGRTLYDRLKEQKDKKQDEFEDQLKFKNMIYKGLDEEDATFLSTVSEKQAEIHNRRFAEESSELLSYRAAVEKIADATDRNVATTAPQKAVTKKASSKLPFLSNVIIRKRSKTDTDPPDTKRQKSDDTKSDERKAAPKIEKDHVKVPVSLTSSSLTSLTTYSDTESSDDDS